MKADKFHPETVGRQVGQVPMKSAGNFHRSKQSRSSVGSRKFGFARPLMALLVLLACFSGAYGHDVSRSESRIFIQNQQARVELRLNLLELGYVDTKANGFISDEELNGAIAKIYAEVTHHYILAGPEPPTQIVLEAYRVTEDHVADLQLLYRFPHAVTQLTVSSTLSQITRPTHQHLVSATLNGTEYGAVLNASNPTAVFTPIHTPALKTFSSFLRLGIGHIFTGYDHLAFLVGLLVVSVNISSLIKIITSFTIAHSLTLALATLDLVVLPSRFTESLIALSIAYVAVENLLGKRAIDRHRIVFIFGLAHGFGFSSVLREMELPRSSLVLSLFSFNLGVELGQIAFVLLLFPLVMYMTSSEWRQPLQRIISCAVLCLAMYWFGQRAFLL